MEIPTDTVITKLISDAQYIAERSKNSLAWHAVQQLQQLRNPLHTAAERQAAYDAVAYLYGRPGFSHGTPAYDGAIADADALERATAHYIFDGDPIAAEARAFGAGAVETAIDQAYAYATLDDALYSHHLNAHDTLGEVFHALRGDGRLEFTACQYSPTEYRAAACRALADALYRHYMPDAADRAGALRALRNVLGSRLVARWLE